MDLLYSEGVSTAQVIPTTLVVVKLIVTIFRIVTTTSASYVKR